MADTGSESDKAVALAYIRGAVATMRESLRQRYDNIDEDSYASRTEARNDLAFVTQFEQIIAKVKPGDEIDLRRVGINYGHDPEEAYSDRNVGLEYVPAIERERSQYGSDIQRIQPFIDRLEDAEVKVCTDFREIWHEDHYPDVFRSDQRSLNRYLDLQSNAPALLGVLADIGFHRLWLEEQFERTDDTKRDVLWKLHLESGYLRGLEDAILRAKPGDAIDLRIVAVNDGRRETIAPNLYADPNYETTIPRTNSEYQQYIGTIQKYIARLEAAGATVLTGFREIAAKDLDPAIGVEPAALNRYLDDREARSQIKQAPRPVEKQANERAVTDAATYWSGVAKSASTVAGQQLSESVTQRRGRAM